MGKIKNVFIFVGVIIIVYVLLKLVIKPIPEEAGVKIIIVALLSIIAYVLIKIIKYVRACKFVKQYNKKVDDFGEMLDGICAEMGMFVAGEIIQAEIQNAEFQQLLVFLQRKGKSEVDKERYLKEFLFAMAEEGLVSKVSVLNQEAGKRDILFKSTHMSEKPSCCNTSITLSLD